MRRTNWSDQARRDLREAIAYVAEHDVGAAAALRKRIGDALSILARHSIGRPGRVAGLFEKPVVGTLYTIAYSLEEREIVVVRIIHQSRDWPQGGWPAD